MKRVTLSIALSPRQISTIVNDQKYCTTLFVLLLCYFMCCLVDFVVCCHHAVVVVVVVVAVGWLVGWFDHGGGAGSRPCLTRCAGVRLCLTLSSVCWVVAL